MPIPNVGKQTTYSTAIGKPLAENHRLGCTSAIRPSYILWSVRRLTVLLACPLLAAGPPATFVEHTIATDLRGGYQVVVADLNHDGKPDLIALASGMSELVWYENRGWQRHVLATGHPA